MVSSVLQARAKLLRDLRSFLDRHGLCEVQTPLITNFAAVEAHIEPFGFSPKGPYLITSPEYSMKQLLAAGSGSIYQLSSVFRQEEQGDKHHPEFSMLEFYLVGKDHNGLMDFLDQLLVEVLRWPQPRRIDYVELFLSQLGINPMNFTSKEFAQCLSTRQIPVPEYLLLPECDSTDQLDYLFGVCLEPTLGQDRPVFLFGYPGFMASLSRLDSNPSRSTRFELFYQEMELGNGFYELNDSAEQRRRFEATNRLRVQAGKAAWALDEPFIRCLDQLPDCAGIALGVDRLLMIQLGENQINQVISNPTDWAKGTSPG